MGYGVFVVAPDVRDMTMAMMTVRMTISSTGPILASWLCPIAAHAIRAAYDHNAWRGGRVCRRLAAPADGDADGDVDSRMLMLPRVASAVLFIVLNFAVEIAGTIFILVDVSAVVAAYLFTTRGRQGLSTRRCCTTAVTMPCGHEP